MQSKYVLKIGQSGDLVKVLQELLNIKADGIFGSETKIEVVRFQKKIKFSFRWNCWTNDMVKTRL